MNLEQVHINAIKNLKVILERLALHPRDQVVKTKTSRGRIPSVQFFFFPHLFLRLSAIPKTQQFYTRQERLP